MLTRSLRKFKEEVLNNSLNVRHLLMSLPEVILGLPKVHPLVRHTNASLTEHPVHATV